MEERRLSEKNANNASVALTPVSQGYCAPCSSSRYKVPLSVKSRERPLEMVPQRSTKQCTRCGDMGHFASDCRTKICAYCKTRGHLAERCFSDPKNCCAKCGVFGHESNNCLVCERCGDAGHAKVECRTKICEDCGKRGHLAASCWHSDRCGVKGPIACRSKLRSEMCKQPHKKCADDSGEEISDL